MGASPSMGKLNPTGIDTFFSLSFDTGFLNALNNVQLLFAPENIIQVTEKVVSSYWKLN